MPREIYPQVLESVLDLEKNIFGMCTMNSTEASKPTGEDTKADFIFKPVFCNYL